MTITDCLDTRPAPCAAACLDLQRPPLEVAGEEVAAFGAAVAAEHPCVYSRAADIAALNAWAAATAEGDSSTADPGAPSGTVATFGIAGN